MLTVKISGTGSYLPLRVVTNEDMSSRIGSTPEWIYSHTGIRSRHVDWSDRSNAMLFGDGAAAVALETADGPACHLSASLLGADGNGSDFITREGGAHKPLIEDFLHVTASKMDVPYLRMDGHAVYAFAVRKLAEVISSLCAQVPIPLDSLDLIFPHQANSRILEAVARRMSLPQDMRLAFAGFGSGLTWAGMLAEWPYL